MAELAELIERARASQPSHFDWTDYADDTEVDARTRARRRRVRELVAELDRARALELDWYVWIRDVWSVRKGVVVR